MDRQRFSSVSNQSYLSGRASNYHLQHKASIGRYSHQSECATVAWPSQGQEDCSACDPQEQDSFLGFLDNCFPAPSLQPVQHSSQAACQVDFNPLKRKFSESGEISDCSSFDSLLGDLEQCSARHCKQRVKPPSPLGASAQSGHTSINGSNTQSFDQSGLAMGVAGVDQFLDASHYECLDQFRQASYAPSNAQVSQIKPGITQIGSGVYRLGANPFQATAAPDVSFQQCSINLNSSLMASPCHAVGYNGHKAAAARNTPEPYADVSLSQQSSQSAWGSPIAPQQCMLTPTRVPCPDRVAPGSGPYAHSAPRQTHQTFATLYAAPCEQQLPQQQQQQQQQGFTMLSRQQSTNSEITTLTGQRTSSNSGMQLLLRAGSAGLASIAGSSHSSMELTSDALGDALAVCMPQQQAPGHDQLYEQYSSPSAEQYRKLSIALPAAAGGATAGKQVQQAAAAQQVQQAQQPQQQQAQAIELVCQEKVVVKPSASAAVVEQAQQQQQQQQAVACAAPPAAAQQQAVAYAAPPAAAQQQAEARHGAQQAFVGWFARCRGCGSKTAHEMPVGSVAVPCCPRCKKTMSCFAPTDMDRVLKGLIQVHISWHKAGF